MLHHHKTLFLVVAATGLAVLALVGCDEWRSERGQEETVALAQVPAPVKATIEQEAKVGALKEIEKRTVDGKISYKADIVINGKEQRTVIGEDGKVISRRAGERDDDD